MANKNHTHTLVRIDGHDAPKEIAWAFDKKTLTKHLEDKLPEQVQIKSIHDKKKKKGKPKHRLVITRPMGMPGLKCRWIILKSAKYNASDWQ